MFHLPKNRVSIASWELLDTTVEEKDWQHIIKAHPWKQLESYLANYDDQSLLDISEYIYTYTDNSRDKPQGSTYKLT